MGRAAAWLSVGPAVGGPEAGDHADVPKATYEVRRAGTREGGGISDARGRALPHGPDRTCGVDHSAPIVRRISARLAGLVCR